MSLDDGSPAPPPYSSVAHTPRQSLNPTAPVFLPPYDQLGRNGRNPSSDVSASQGALGELHDRHERRARRWNIGLDPGRAGIVDPYPYPFPENHHHSQGIRTAIAVDLPSIIITLLIIFAVLLSILPLHSFEGSSEYEATFNGKSVRVIEKWSVEWSTSRGPSRTRVRTVSGVVDLWIPKRERQVHVSAPFSAQIDHWTIVILTQSLCEKRSTKHEIAHATRDYHINSFPVAPDPVTSFTVTVCPSLQQFRRHGLDAL